MAAAQSTEPSSQRASAGTMTHTTARMIVYLRPGRGATSMKKMTKATASRKTRMMTGTWSSGGSAPIQVRRSFMGHPFGSDDDDGYGNSGTNRGARGRTAGRRLHADGPPSSDHSAGQAASMFFNTVSRSVPLTQATMPLKNASLPTAPGIRSDASNRNVVFGSCSNSMAWVRMPLEAFSGSRPLLALMTPPSETRLLAQSALERYSCTLMVSSSLEKAPTISPPPVTAFEPASAAGVRKAQMSPSSATLPPASVMKPS